MPPQSPISELRQADHIPQLFATLRNRTIHWAFFHLALSPLDFPHLAREENRSESCRVNILAEAKELVQTYQISFF
jgi:hypothetical protein